MKKRNYDIGEVRAKVRALAELVGNQGERMSFPATSMQAEIDRGFELILSEIADDLQEIEDSMPSGLAGLSKVKHEAS